MTQKLIQGTLSDLASRFAKMPDGVLKQSSIARAALAGVEMEPGRAEEIVRLLSNPRGAGVRVSKSPYFKSHLEGHRLEQAAQDYYRCVLARASMRTFQKMVPKFRNQAARSNLFGKLSSALEDVHLSRERPSLFSTVATEELDDVGKIMHAEFWGLVKAGYDPEEELEPSIATARKEYARYVSQLEALTDTRWEQSDRYLPKLKLVSFFDPFIEDKEDTMRWGVSLYCNLSLLNINPSLLYFDPLRRAVVAREAAAMLSPRSMDRMEMGARVICEQSDYLAYKLLENKYEKELWTHARHGRRKATRARGKELVDFFQTYEMLVGDGLYRELWSRLGQVAGSSLKRSDYLFIFETLAARPTWPKFEPNEIQLLRLLARRPDIGSREVARFLKLSIPTATRLLENVSKKAGLLFTTVVNVRKLGLQAHWVFMSTNRESDVRSVLTRFLYCRQLYRSYGSMDLFAVVDAPQGRESFLDRFLARMKETGLINSFQKSKVIRNFQNISFENYDEAAGKWNVRWDIWKITLRDALRQANEQPAGYQNELSTLAFNKMDLDVLDNLNENCRKSFSEVGRNLKVTGAYVGQRVRRLLDAEAFKPAIWPLKLGAEDWGLFVIQCDQKVARTLVPFLDELPGWRGALLEGDYSGIAGLVWVPTGELKLFFKALDDAVIREGFASRSLLQAVGEWLLGRFLPVGPEGLNLFSDSDGWMLNEDAFMSLVS